MKNITWLALLGMVAGCALQKAQRARTDRMARQAAGECAYERTHPAAHPAHPVRS